MSGAVKSKTAARKRGDLGSLIRSEFSLIIGVITAAIFLWFGSRLVENLEHPGAMGVVFVWLFVAVLWSAISVVRLADCLAIKCGEPYGTLILTLSAITIEVMMISAAMLHGKNNPTLARDMMFAVIMIALNGLIGLSLLLGGLRHHEQHYNLQGASAYLNTIMVLAVLGLVVPNFTTSMSGPRFSTEQEVFLATTSIGLYAIFLLIQTTRHSQYFMESKGAGHASEHRAGPMHSTIYHAVMLILYLLVVVVLAEKFAIPLDNSIERFGMPQALGGAIVAGLVLAPEALSGINAARQNQLQRSVNILHGSVLASIGLTIPAVLTIGMISKRSVTLGIEGGNLPLLLLTLAVSVVTFTSGKTNVLQGCIHLLLFAVFLLLIFCPRFCKLNEGQRGFCFVRQRAGDRMVLTTYGRSSGFCVDPVEKKPLNHFYPGSSILSFGTAGCNLACKFCQNWDISKSREMDRLQDQASPERIADAALKLGCKSVAFTYNDPVIFAEYAMDIADACHAKGVKAVAVTAGYIHAEPRREFYAKMDAANVDLKGFTDDFYYKICGGRLQPVLDTLVYLVKETGVWTEITTLLIPGKNDSDAELEAECKWVMQHLGADVPLHFTAFHPDWKMTDVPPTPPATLTRAREIALRHGLRYVYTGNVHDETGGSTYCPACGNAVVVRDWYDIRGYHLADDGACRSCGTRIGGRFQKFGRPFGPRRIPVRLESRV